MLQSFSRAKVRHLGCSALSVLSGSWLAVAACSSSGSSDGARASGGAGNSAGTMQASGGAFAGSGTLATGAAGNGGSSVTNGGSSNGGSAGLGNGATGGNPAAGSGGSSAGAPGAGCSASGLAFCDDFEKLAPGPVQNAGPWTTAYIGPDAPTITVDTSTAHSGTHSIKVHAPLTDYQSFLIYHDPAVLPLAQGSFYLRSYVRLGRAMSAEHNSFMVFDRFAAPGAGAAVRLGEQSQMLSLTVGGDAHGSLSNGKFSQDGVLGPHFTANTWACLEGYFNSVQPEIDFWLDGVEISDFHHTDWPADNYDTLRFGFEKYGGPELDIWFDDIAFSATRIGCQ